MRGDKLVGEGERQVQTGCEGVDQSETEMQAESDITFHPQVTSTPSSTPDVEPKPDKSSEVKRRAILDHLQLPQLKDKGE